MSTRTKMLAVMGAITMLASGTANAVTALPTTTLYFQGTCTDCQGFGTGQLTLRNYTYGSSITLSNFVSFHYDGTNLQPAFTISSPDYTSGSISGPGTTMDDTFFVGNNYFFTSSTVGTWNLGPTSRLADFGTAGTFSTTAPSAAAVPEPAAWLTMILGMGAVGFAMRRRKTVTTRVRFA